jgi:hypothetical protein
MKHITDLSKGLAATDFTADLDEAPGIDQFLF